MGMQWTALCNGSPMKVGDRQDCLDFCAIQRRKKKGAGLADSATMDDSEKAGAARCRWTVRREEPGDRASLTRLDDAPAKPCSALSR